MKQFKQDDHDPEWGTEGKTFTVPLGVEKSGRLRFSSGASGVTLGADQSLAELARAQFTRQIPEVRAEGGIITVHYRRFPVLDWLTYSRDAIARITLNGSLPWEIEFTDGLSRLDGDLAQLQLRALDVLGGASRVTLRLAEPDSPSFIYIAGGASKVTLRRPAGVGVRLQIQGGASHLAFDGQRFGALARGPRLQSADFDGTGGYYDICIAGGASHLTIDRQAQGG